jgi:hypothetical protein
MVFDLARGLYWRLEEDGLLFGMSNPVEALARARDRLAVPASDAPATRCARARRAGARPAPGLAATIDFTPDSPADRRAGDHPGGRPDRGSVVASAGGHG